MEALGFLFVIGIVVAAVIAHNKQKKKLEMTLGALGQRLGQHDLAQQVAWGQIGGAAVSFRLTTRGSGKSRTLWTEIDAEIPRQYPLCLFVRKHGWGDQGNIDRGDMVDVIVGEPYFDHRFLVEAAPAEVARILLDPRERSYLMALSETLHFYIDTIRTNDPPLLRLSVQYWIHDIHEAMRGIEAMAAIAGRVRDAYAAVDAAAKSLETGSPYRPVLDDSEAREAADARLAEVAQLDKLRTVRAAREQTIAVALVILFVLGGIIAAAVGD